MSDISWNVDIHDTELLINSPVYVVRYTINLQKLVFGQTCSLHIYLQPTNYARRESNLSRLAGPKAEV
jgi:hypothetical protein